MRLSLLVLLLVIPFATAFAESQTSNNPWGDGIIQKQVEITEKQVTNQLGHDPQVACC
jgi:hypothetical protein